VALARRFPGLRGFTRPNLFRMRQFFEAYRSNRKVSALLRQLPWTHHLLILGQAKPTEAREFYILAAIKTYFSTKSLFLPRSTLVDLVRSRSPSRTAVTWRARTATRQSLATRRVVVLRHGPRSVREWAASARISPVVAATRCPEPILTFAMV